MPAYNIEKTLELTVSGIPKNVADEILVINDASQDNTVAIAKKLNVVLITHQKNIGYGGAQKTGYTEALKREADVVVMLHGDFQYDPTLVPLIIAPLVSGTADACFGSRLHSKSSNAKGMPWWRFAANIALSRLEETVFHLGLSEYHTGYRAYTREVLQSIPFYLNSDNYVFDSEIIAQIASGDFRVAEIPIPIRYEKDSQSPNFFKSTQYGLMTLIVVAKYLLHRLHVKTCAQFVIARRGSAV